MSFEGVGLDGPILSAEISYLAALGLAAVARRGLTPLEGVQMGERLGAVAILGNRVDVNMVDYGSR